MARQDPTLITFRLPRDVVRDIESRSDCPPRAGADRVGGVSLWVRELVMRELGLDSGSDTSQLREKVTEDYLNAVSAYWRIKRVITDLQAEPDKKAKDWNSKMTRAEKRLAELEQNLEQYPQEPGHELGCDCQECQKAASSARL